MNKIKFILFHISTVLLIVLLGCKDKNAGNIKKFYYENGNLRSVIQIENGKRNGLTIHYYNNGNIASLENYKNDTINGEVFSFYENGNLERKSIMSMGVANGPNYAFYKSGFIKDYRNWKKGMKQGSGTDYWDREGILKAVYYARNDTLIYKTIIDSVGLVLSTEGEIPSHTILPDVRGKW